MPLRYSGMCEAMDRWAMLHRDLDVTASLLDAEHPGDGAAWRALVDQWQRIGPSLVDALVTPFPPLGPALRAMIKLPRVGGLSFVRQLLAPASVALEQRVRRRRGAVAACRKRFARRHCVGRVRFGLSRTAVDHAGSDGRVSGSRGWCGQALGGYAGPLRCPGRCSGLQRRGDQDHRRARPRGRRTGS